MRVGNRNQGQHRWWFRFALNMESKLNLIGAPCQPDGEYESVDLSMTDDDITKTQKDLLWGLYQEHRNHARHNETMRANITNYVIAISAGLVSLIALGGKLDASDLPLTIMLIAVGLPGTIFSASHTERYHRHRQRASEHAQELDRLWFEGGLSAKNAAEGHRRTLKEVKACADRDHLNRDIYRILRKATNTHVLWLIFPLLISLIGAILTIAVSLK